MARDATLSIMVGGPRRSIPDAHLQAMERRSCTWVTRAGQVAKAANQIWSPQMVAMGELLVFEEGGRTAVIDAITAALR
jgi:3-hydroxyisobutyrate dehydrogenase-like beta-hydroxyacid dehydrogenase